MGYYSCPYPEGESYAVPKDGIVEGYTSKQRNLPQFCGKKQKTLCGTDGKWGSTSPLFSSCTQNCLHPDTGVPVEPGFEYAFIVAK